MVTDVVMWLFTCLSLHWNNLFLLLIPNIISGQISCLGAVGFAYWMIRALITAYWTWARTDVDDAGSASLAWNTAKFRVHGITTAFLMGLFHIVDTPTVSNSIGSRNVKMNHFLVPAVMPTILGTFLGMLIDQYVGPLARKMRLVKEPDL